MFQWGLEKKTPSKVLFLRNPWTGEGAGDNGSDISNTFLFLLFKKSLMCWTIKSMATGIIKVDNDLTLVVYLDDFLLWGKIVIKN